MNTDKGIDQITIKRAAKGDKKAFAKIYNAFYDFVWKVVFRTSNGDFNDASEILQQTFIRIYKSLSTFMFDSKFSTWVYRIAFNTARSYIVQRNRRWERTTEFFENLSSFYTEQLADNQEEINRILNLLSAEERFLLVSRELEGLTYEDLADITGRNPGALRIQFFRIKKYIKEILATKNIYSAYKEIN